MLTICFATAKVPENIKQDLVMVCDCIRGAEHADNIKTMLEKAGFKDIRMIPKDNSRQIIKSWAPNTNIEDYVPSL